MARHFRLLVLLPLALASCKLIDQTTFAPDPEPEQAVAASTPSRPTNQVALVSIRYDTPAPAFQQPLSGAIRAAEQRRPGSEYDVIGVSTAADAAQVAQDAGAIMAAITGLGVPAARIHLGARIDAAQTVREVLVQIR
jgi:hypothetical protein